MTEYPEDCVQNLTSKWWLEDKENTLCRGALIETYVQFFSQIPLELIPERIDPKSHTLAQLKAQPLNANGRRSTANMLPVAGLPHLAGAHCYLVNRAKKRPCIILGAVDQKLVDKKLTKDMPKNSTHQFILTAPYFSVEQSGRGG